MIGKPNPNGCQAGIGDLPCTGAPTILVLLTLDDGKGSTLDLRTRLCRACAGNDRPVRTADAVAAASGRGWSVVTARFSEEPAKR